MALLSREAVTPSRRLTGEQRSLGSPPPRPRRVLQRVFRLPAEAAAFQRKLDETTRLLRELQEAQNARLSARPPPNAICLLGPSYRELHLGAWRPRPRQPRGGGARVQVVV